MLSTEFRCPRCNSSHFGSGGNRGQCHGFFVHPSGDIRSCDFSWDRNEDYKVFVGRFHNQEEYDLLTGQLKLRL